MMVLGKLKEFIMHDVVFTISLLISIVTFIVSVTFFHYSELKSVEKNVESAIVKGIDPIAVRCAYANASDNVCIAYAASHQSAPVKTSK